MHAPTISIYKALQVQSLKIVPLPDFTSKQGIISGLPSSEFTFSDTVFTEFTFNTFIDGTMDSPPKEVPSVRVTSDNSYLPSLIYVDQCELSLSSEN